MKRFPIAQRFWKVWRKVHQTMGGRWAIRFLVSLIVIGFLSPILATSQPWYISYRGESWFPAFTSLWNPERIEVLPATDSTGREEIQFDIQNWRELDADFVWWAPVPWSPNQPDVFNRDFTGPFAPQMGVNSKGKLEALSAFHRHHLGTDLLGNDVLAHMIHGAATSMQIGLFSAALAILIGLFFGIIAGYYGDYRLKISRIALWFSIPGLFFGYFWAFQVRSYVLTDALREGFIPTTLAFVWSLILMLFGFLLFVMLGQLLSRFRWGSTAVSVPIDSMLQRITEVFLSMPRLLVILTMAALFREKSLAMVITIIGITQWTPVARFARGEMLRIRDLDYIAAARALGLPWYKILGRHALPAVMQPVSIEIMFIIAGSILVESSLSFLGIGLPDDAISWGALLKIGREQLDAWWMVVFPGLLIFLTLLSLNALGDALRKPLKS